jgi:hypothetical protein
MFIRLELKGGRKAYFNSESITMIEDYEGITDNQGSVIHTYNNWKWYVNEDKDEIIYKLEHSLNSK